MFASQHAADSLGQIVAARLSASQVNLFHCGLVLAGQPDLLMRDVKGNIIIVDWKRSRQIRFENDRCSLKYPLSHLPDSCRRSCFSVFVPLPDLSCENNMRVVKDCNFWLYSLQLAVYRHMLGPYGACRARVQRTSMPTYDT